MHMIAVTVAILAQGTPRGDAFYAALSLFVIPDHCSVWNRLGTVLLTLPIMKSTMYRSVDVFGITKPAICRIARHVSVYISLSPRFSLSRRVLAISPRFSRSRRVSVYLAAFLAISLRLVYHAAF